MTTPSAPKHWGWGLGRTPGPSRKVAGYRPDAGRDTNLPLGRPSGEDIL